MLAGVRGLGLVVFGDVAHRMTNVVAVEIPEGVAGDAARTAMLEDFGIEIGTSFGPLHGKVWRIDVGMAKAYGGPVQVLEIIGDQLRVIS
jgi:(S)-ureidoglycine-glyoxylate aminotransferase